MSWTQSFANSPKGSNSLGNVDDEIRQLKNEISTFMARDHFFDVPTNGDGAANVLMLSNQGRMRPGSAKLQSGVGATMGLPTTRPDGTAFSSADDGRTAWAYDSTRGLIQYVFYWKNDTDGGAWWPLSTLPVGSVMAWRGSWVQNVNSPQSLALNTMPGWFKCDGANLGTIQYNFGVGSGTTQRVISVAPNGNGVMPDMQGSHLRGIDDFTGLASGTKATAGHGVETPSMAAFSKTLVEANLPSHQHALSDGNAKIKTTVATHGPKAPAVRESGYLGFLGPGTNTNTHWVWQIGGTVIPLYNAGGGETSGSLYDVAGLRQTWIDSTPVDWTHTPVTTWFDANQKTDAAGSGTAIDFAEAAVSQRWFADVIWVMRVF